MHGDIDQHLVIARIAAFREIRREQCSLQCVLATFEIRPVQQSVRVERVVDS